MTLLSLRGEESMMPDDNSTDIRPPFMSVGSGGHGYRESEIYGIFLRCLAGLWAVCFLYSLYCIAIYLQIKRRGSNTNQPHMNLFIWTSMLPAALIRVAYFLILIMVPPKEGVTVDCLEVGDCDSPLTPSLRSAQFYTILTHDAFYPLLIIIYSGIMLHWFEVQYYLYRSLSYVGTRLDFMSTKTLMCFGIMNFIFLSVTVVVDLVYKAHLLGNTSTKKDIPVIDAQLLLFSLGFLIQALGLLVFGRRIIRAVGGARRATKMARVMVVCSSGLSLLASMLLLIPLPTLTGITNGFFDGVVAVLYSILMKILELALCIFIIFIMNNKQAKKGEVGGGAAATMAAGTTTALLSTPSPLRNHNLLGIYTTPNSSSLSCSPAFCATYYSSDSSNPPSPQGYLSSTSSPYQAFSPLDRRLIAIPASDDSGDAVGIKDRPQRLYDGSSRDYRQERKV